MPIKHPYSLWNLRNGPFAWWRLLLPRPEFMSFFLFIFKFGGPSEVFLPAFLDSGLPRGNRLEGNSWVPCKVPSLPNPTIREGWPHHRGLWPLLFSNSDVDSFTSHKNKSVKVLWDRTYGFLSLSEKTRKSNHLKISFITEAVLSSQLFKDPECLSGWGLNTWPRAWQTSALPTELTRRRFR